MTSAPDIASDSPLAPSPGRPGLYVAIALTAHLFLVVLLRHFPYQDTINHVARYVLIDRAWRGEGVPWIRVDWVPTPYLAVDLLGAGLVHLFGPQATVPLLAALSLAALPVGMYLLLRAVAPRERGWALVGVLLSASPFFLKGLLNYQLGVGALFVWISLWWPRRTGASLPASIGLALGVLLLLLIHLAAGGVALLLLGLDALCSLRPQLNHLRNLRMNLRNLRMNALGILASLVLLWFMRDTTPAAPSDHPVIVLHGILPKLWSLTEPFYTFTPWEMVLTLGGYVVAVTSFVRAHRGRWTPNLMAVLVAVLVVLYVITPDEVSGASHLDVRWLLPLYLLVFAIVPGPETAAGPRRGLLLALLAVCLVHAAVLYSVGRGIDRKLDDYETVLARLSPEARVLPLVGGEPEYGRVAPELHFALWHTALTEGRGRVGSLFSYPLRTGELPRSTPIQMRHFHELDPPWSLDRPWRVMGKPAIPWDRIRAGYDDIILAGEDPDLAAILSTNACEVDRRGEIRVYAVGRPCAS